VGKALLAWKELKEVRNLLGEGCLDAFTQNTLTEVDDLVRHLETVRSKGYALDNEEREIGVRCVTAPIRDHNGEVMAALSLSAPSSRLPNERVEQTAARVKGAADEVSLRLGFLRTKDSPK
jgi:DNA-binding IclR family transcriptional regulator